MAKNKIKPPEGCLATYKVAGGDPIYVDPEFKTLLEPLTPAEVSQLEANLVADKRALEPVVVWKERRIVMDGHNRLEVCVPRKLPYTLAFMSFPDTPEGRTKALEWIVEHQTGRRNLSEEAKKKLVEWRRARVAAAVEAGDSNREIAAREKVTETTIRRDIHATGAAAKAPDAVTGKDGKTYPRSRADRVGQKAPLPFVPKGERMAGDDTEAIKADKKAARSEPKNGKPIFDWPAFNREFANFVLNVDKLGKAYKAENSPQADELRRDMTNWRDRFRNWGQAISKKEPVPDAVEKVRRGRGRLKKGAK